MSIPRWRPHLPASRRSRWVLVLSAVILTLGAAMAGVLLVHQSPDTAGRTATDGCAQGRPTRPAAGEHTFRYGDADRSYLLAVPDGYREETAYPLVLNFHGHGGDKTSYEAKTEMGRKGAARGYLVVTPDALGDPRQWNWKAPGSDGKADDFGFASALVADLRRWLCIDDRRIYAAGHSNGSVFAALFACRSPDTFAAFAMVSASVPVTCPDNVTPAVLAVHGTADRVPYEGGAVDGNRRLPPVPEIVKGYADRYRCNPAPARDQPIPGVERTRYSGCARGADVVLDTITGGTHSWPGSARGSDDPDNSTAGRTFDATGEILDFFDAHRAAAG